MDIPRYDGVLRTGHVAPVHFFGSKAGLFLAGGRRANMLHRLMASRMLFHIGTCRSSTWDTGFRRHSVYLTVFDAMLIDNKLMSPLINMQIFGIDCDIIAEELGHLFQRDILGLR